MVLEFKPRDELSDSDCRTIWLAKLRQHAYDIRSPIGADTATQRRAARLHAFLLFFHLPHESRLQDLCDAAGIGTREIRAYALGYLLDTKPEHRDMYLRMIDRRPDAFMRHVRLELVGLKLVEAQHERA